MPQFFGSTGKPIITPAGKPSFGGCGGEDVCQIFQSATPEQLSVSVELNNVTYRPTDELNCTNFTDISCDEIPRDFILPYVEGNLLGFQFEGFCLEGAGYSCQLTAPSRWRCVVTLGCTPRQINVQWGIYQNGSGTCTFTGGQGQSGWWITYRDATFPEPILTDTPYDIPFFRIDFPGVPFPCSPQNNNSFATVTFSA